MQLNWTNNTKRILTVVALWPILALSTLARPLTLPEVVDAREPGWRSPLTMSSDGRRVAFCVMQPSRKQPMLSEEFFRSKSGVFGESVGNDIYIAELDGRVFNLTEGQGTSYAPVWSPDGRKLAFISDRDGAARLWIWEEGRVRRLSESIVWLGVGWDRPAWTGDSQSIILKMLPSGLSVAQATRQELGQQEPLPTTMDETEMPVKVYDSRQSAPTKAGSSRRGVAQLQQVWLSSRTSKVLGEKIFCCGGWVSPDSRYYAYTQYEGKQSATNQLGLFRLRVVDLTSGQMVSQSPPFASDFGSGVSWSPDSQQLAYFSKKSITDYSQCEVFRMKLAGQLDKITEGPYFQETRGPLWQDNSTLVLRSNSEVVRCSLDGRTQAIAVANSDWVNGPGEGPYSDGGKLRLLGPAGLIELDWSTGSCQSLPGSANSNWSQAVANRKGQTYFLNALSASGHELGLHQGGNSRTVFSFNPQFETKNLGRPQLLKYADRSAAMLLPPDYKPGERYPVVMVIYGGDMSSRYLTRFGLGSSAVDNYHLLASRGYIVVRPDLPIANDPVDDIARGVDLAADALVEQGYADPSRMAILGHSYGGYSVLAVITRSTRFAAAVARVGISNLVNEYLRFDDGKASFLAYTETGQGKMHCTLWENRQRFIENSPVFWLDRVQTPLMLVHGQKDNTAWVDETGQTFVGLQRLGKPVIYLAYPGEGHWEASWTREHQLDYLDRLLQFLKECQVAPGP